MERPKKAGRGVASKIGPTLRTLRERAGMPQGEVARRIGIDTSGLSRIEHGHQAPSIRQIEAIAATLGTDLASVVAAAGSNTPARKRGAV